MTDGKRATSCNCGIFRNFYIQSTVIIRKYSQNYSCQILVAITSTLENIYAYFLRFLDLVMGMASSSPIPAKFDQMTSHYIPETLTFTIYPLQQFKTRR
jgi:hypothetical protein